MLRLREEGNQNVCKTYNNCVKKEEVDLDERIGLGSLGYGIGGVANAMAAKQMAKPL